MTKIEDVLIRHQILIQRLAATQHESMADFIDEAFNRTRTRLSQLRYLTPSDGKLLERELVRIFNTMSYTTLGNLDDFAQYEAEFVSRVLNSEAIPDKALLSNKLRRVNMKVGLAQGKQAKSLEVTLNQFGRRKAKQLVHLARQITIQKLSPELAEKAFIRLMNKIDAQAKALANTITNHAATVAKDEVYLLNKKFITYLEWVSVLDSGTTDYCRSQSGKRYPIGEGPRPPAHFGCRSLMSPGGL